MNLKGNSVSSQSLIKGRHSVHLARLIMPFLLSRTRNYVTPQSCTTPGIQTDLAAQSSSLIDKVNSAGLHLPNRGRQHRRKCHPPRTEQEGRWCRQQDRDTGKAQGQPQKLLPTIAVYGTSRRHTGHLLPKLGHSESQNMSH